MPPELTLNVQVDNINVVKFYESINLKIQKFDMEKIFEFNTTNDLLFRDRLLFEIF